MPIFPGQQIPDPMKFFFLPLALVAMQQAAPAQANPPAEEHTYFIVLYTTGENWDTTKAHHEQTYFSEHSAHLSSLRKQQKIQVGARYSNTGMIILQARDSAEAQEIVHRDPAVRNKLFKAEIHPLYPFYAGCLE